MQFLCVTNKSVQSKTLYLASKNIADTRFIDTNLGSDLLFEADHALSGTGQLAGKFDTWLGLSPKLLQATRCCPLCSSDQKACHEPFSESLRLEISPVSF